MLTEAHVLVGWVGYMRPGSEALIISAFPKRRIIQASGVVVSVNGMGACTLVGWVRVSGSDLHVLLQGRHGHANSGDNDWNSPACAVLEKVAGHRTAPGHA